MHRQRQKQRVSPSPGNFGVTIRKRGASTSSQLSEAPSNITRQSSMRHRILNRLASGLLPSESITVSRPPSPVYDELPALQESKRQQITKAVLNVHQGDINMNGSMLFAIDVGCCYKAEGCLPLNATIIVDNSLFCSPATLLASCDTALHIASFLNRPHDQLSVYCSCPEPTTPVFNCAGSRARNLKSILDSIHTVPGKPEPGYLCDAVRIASQAMMPLVTSHVNSGPKTGSSGHIFVLTSNPFALERLSLGKSLQVHVICAGAIPWSLPSKYTNNGWRIIDRRTSFPDGSASSRERDRDFHAQVRQLMNSARSGYLADYLRNVRLSISSGPHSTIEAVLGSTSFASFAPGDFRTALVKVRLLKTAKAPALSSFPRGLRTPSGQVDLYGEVHAALTEQPLPALTLQLKYEHSALPLGTTCEISRSVHLRSVESPPMNGPDCSFMSNSSPERDEHQHRVTQARLAFHLAMTHSQRRASNMLETQFGSTGSGSVAIEYARTIVDELKYQARVFERFEAPRTRCGSRTNPRSSIPLTCGPLHSASLHMNNSQITLSEVNLETFPDPAAPLAPLAPLQPRRRGSNDGDDKARQIWVQINQKKQSASQQRVEKEPSTDTLRRIKQTAENNRRSLGADTLRSLRHENMKENAPTPWC